MQILQSCEQMLAYCGITNAQHVQIGRFRVPKQAIWIYIMLTQVYFGGMQVAVIAKNYRGGLPAILFAVHCIVLIASKATIYAVMVVNTGKMFRLMAYLEAVVNARSKRSDVAEAIYLRRDARDLEIVQMIFVGMASLVFLSYVPSALCWLLTLLVGVPLLDFLSVPLGTQQVMPFDSHTYVGFAAAWTNELFFCEWFIVITIGFLSFYIGVCSYFEPCIEDLTAIIDQSSQSIGRPAIVKEKLVQFIELHLHFYAMAEMLEKIVTGALFIHMPIFSGIVAVIFYQMENNINDLSLDTFINVNELFFYATDTYIVCYFIAMIMIHSLSIGDLAYGSHWYSMERRDKVIVEMVIRRAQQPVEIKGLGVFVCSLETFLRMSRSAVSYYMVFRQLNVK